MTTLLRRALPEAVMDALILILATVLGLVLAAGTALAAPNAPIGSCTGAVMIATTADWSKLNGPESVFCVVPGAYAATLTVTTDGTAAAPRVLRFVSSSEAYKPWHETVNRAINTGLVTFSGAHNWVVDGLRFTVAGGSNVIKIQNSTNFVLQNVLIEGGGNGTGQLNLRPGNSNFTLQNRCCAIPCRTPVITTASS